MALAECLRAFGIDERGAPLKILRIEHLLHRAVHRNWIGHVCVGVGKPQFHRFNLQMLSCRAIHRMVRDVHMLQDAERNQGRDPLTVRRDLVQPMTIDIDANRRHPFG